MNDFDVLAKGAAAGDHEGGPLPMGMSWMRTLAAGGGRVAIVWAGMSTPIRRVRSPCCARAAAGPLSSFPDQTPAPSVLYRTHAKSFRQCHRQSAAIRLSLLPAQRGVPTPRHDVDPTPRSPSRNFRNLPPAYRP